MSSNQNNRGLETIPFQIVNQSGFDAPLYIWIQGIIPEKTPNEYVYVNRTEQKHFRLRVASWIRVATSHDQEPQREQPCRIYLGVQGCI
jgi:hypothetical protein